MRHSPLLLPLTLFLLLTSACTADLTGEDRDAAARRAAAEAAKNGELSCDIEAVLKENGCSAGGCHGSRNEGNLDLLSAGFESNLVGRRSETDTCRGELLVDPEDPEASLLLRMVDPDLFESTDTCGTLMPIGGHPLVEEDIECVNEWVHHLASDGSMVVREPFEAHAPHVYANKIKVLLGGAAVETGELLTIETNPDSLRGLTEKWAMGEAYERKLRAFLTLNLQQLSGSVREQIGFGLVNRENRLRRLEENVRDSFVRTAMRIIEQGRPFSEIATTTEWELTTAQMVQLAYTDLDAVSALRDQPFTFQSSRLEGDPESPWDPSYQFENKRFLIEYDDCTLEGPTEGTPKNALQVLFGYMDLTDCKTRLGGESPISLKDEDFTDFRTIKIEHTPNPSERTDFFALDKLRTATTLKLTIPRVGFFTSPSFLATWETNDDNRFRVTASQALIAGLGKEFTQVDPTDPVNLLDLSADHVDPSSSCYACHQHLDPITSYFRQGFSTSYRGMSEEQIEVADTLSPAFSFQGETRSGGSLFEFAESIADHKDFESGWVQKLCYFFNSSPCYEGDPLFIEIAKNFSEHEDFQRMLLDLINSPLVTRANEFESYDLSTDLVSITRRDHLCGLLEERLPIDNVCEGLGDDTELIAKDDLLRTSAAPVQATHTGSLHLTSAEAICRKLADKLVGGNKSYKPDEWEELIPRIVGEFMGLSTAHPRRLTVIDQLLQHRLDALAAEASEEQALKSVVQIACASPDVMGLGL